MSYDKIYDKRCFSTGCCGNNCASGKNGETRVSSCNCQNNVGCLAGARSGLRSTGSVSAGACQCVEEEIWNSNVPPKPNCRWLNNFAELRRQWGDHGRQQAYKCCSRPCRTVAPCRPRLSPTTLCAGTTLLTSDCQKCCGSRRLAGGASKSEMAPADKSSSPEPPNRKTGDGCPSCGHPSTRYNSPNADCTSSCCSSQCRHPRASRRTPDCQPCALKSILKKRCLPNCYQCNASRGCLCQSMPRGCKCSLPIQVDAHATYECSCDCSSRPECVCPPSERRCLRKTVKCPNARPCYCPCPQLPKCYCPHYQPSPCGPCASPKYRRPLRFKDLCSPCPFCPPCRPVSTTSSCRPPTPQKKLTFCTGRSDRPSSFCTGQSWCGIIDDKSSESSVCSERSDNQRRELHERNRDCCYATGSDNGFKCTNQSHNLLNEGSTQNPTFINLSIILNLSKSVDPDSRDMPEGRDETVFENAKEENALEGCIVEKSSQDS